MKYIILMMAGLINLGEAKDLQFEKLWSQVSEKSLAIKASNSNIEAGKINVDRSKNNWSPTLYLSGSSYFSNDPGANMFGLLSQRSITQSDFMPDKLNHPDTTLASKVAIGLYLSLYEGGMANARENASRWQQNAKVDEAKNLNIQIYTETAKNYFYLQALHHQNNDLVKVSNTIDGILGKYTVGSKANLVGYSGLLGLKSLKNRLLALVDEINGKKKMYSNGLNELSQNENAFEFLDRNKLLDTLNEYLPSANTTTYEKTSLVNSLENNAKAAAAMIEAENSRNKPRVGAFLEDSVFHGERKTATSYSAGLMINWNIYSANDVGAGAEAQYRSEAAIHYSQAIEQKEKIEFSATNEAEVVLLKTLKTLEESQKLLDEQMNIANNLFKNGMINALQLVEILSRRVDLLTSQSEVEIKLIEVKAKKLNVSNIKPALLK